jgi:hypothetical protein
MQPIKRILLVTSALLLSATPEAEAMEVRAGNVEVNTGQDGSVFIDTGRTRLSLPATRYRSYVNVYPRPGSYQYNRPDFKFSCSGRGRRSSQQTTQITRSNRGIVSSQIYTSQCR